MQATNPRPVVLIAEDDADDRLLAEEAFRVSLIDCEIRFVADGEQLLAYLRAQTRAHTEREDEVGAPTDQESQ